MVRTSILVEVDERVNDLVVVPHKRNKTFSKLMASLLQGYVEDDYIRAYADGTLDDMRRASVDVLDEALNSMSASLSNMGVFGDELKANTMRGVKKFGDYSKKKEEEIARNEEFDNLKGDVDDLKKQNEKILQLLMNMSQGLTVDTTQTSVKPEVNIKDKNVSEESKVVTMPIKEENEVNTQNTIEEVATSSEDYAKELNSVETVSSVSQNDTAPNEDEESNINVSNLLRNLMVGNQYSF